MRFFRNKEANPARLVRNGKSKEALDPQNLDLAEVQRLFAAIRTMFVIQNPEQTFSKKSERIVTQFYKLVDIAEQLTDDDLIKTINDLDQALTIHVLRMRSTLRLRNLEKIKQAVKSGIIGNSEKEFFWQILDEIESDYNSLPDEFINDNKHLFMVDEISELINDLLSYFASK